MWIERIAIENFLAFREFAADFDRGLNVVIAPNEGGKSSLLRAVTTALFVDAASRSAEVKSLARWGSRDLFRLELALSIGGRRYRLIRDFRAKEQEIRLEGEPEPVARGKAVEAFLAERLAIPDQNLFLRVCGVRHEELVRVGDGEANIGERLEEILAGVGQPVAPARAAELLESKRRELVRGVDHPAKEENWGPVKRFSEERESAAAALAEAREAARRREALARAVAERRETLDAIERDLAALAETRNRSVRHRDLASQAAETRIRSDEMRKRVERIRRLSVQREEAAAALERLPERLRAAGPERLGELRAALERESLLERDMERTRSVVGWGMDLYFVIAGLSLLAAGVILGLASRRAFFGVAAAGACLAAWRFHRRRLRAAAAEAGSTELRRLREARVEWSAGASAGTARHMLDEAAPACEALRDIESRLEEAADGVGGSAEEVIKRLDAAYGEAALAARALDEERAALDAFALDAQRILAIEREIAEKTAVRERLRAEVETFERERAAVPASDAAALAERLEAAGEHLARVTRKARTLEIAAAALEEARREVSGFLAGRLPALAEAHLSRLTGSRYETLFFDPRTLAVSAAPAAGDGERGVHALPVPERVDLRFLSQGARDVVYLAVRLALVDLVGRGERQPLFLDDPFVHLDPVRRERAMLLVREFAASHQVILFTCDPAYALAGARVVTLGA